MNWSNKKCQKQETLIVEILSPLLWLKMSVRRSVHFLRILEISVTPMESSSRNLKKCTLSARWQGWYNPSMPSPSRRALQLQAGATSRSSKADPWIRQTFWRNFTPERPSKLLSKSPMTRRGKVPWKHATPGSRTGSTSLGSGRAAKIVPDAKILRFWIWVSPDLFSFFPAL